MSRYNKYQILGMVLIIFSIVQIPLLAELIYDPNPPAFQTLGMCPSSTDPAVPNVITQIGTAKNFWMLVRDVDSSIVLTRLQCVAMDGTYDSGEVSLFYNGQVTLFSIVWDIWEWDAPILEGGHIYAFNWLVQDEAGNEATLTTYGGYGESDGYFSINDENILSQEQKVITSDATLNMKFTATINPVLITGIRVKVFDESGTLLKDGLIPYVNSNTWQSTDFYVFTKAGSYVIEGYIEQSTLVLRKLSILADYGVQIPEFILDLKTAMSIMGFVMGIGLIYKGSKVQNKKRR